MPTSSDSIGSPIRLRRYVWTLTIFWTVAIAIVLTWELLDERDQVYHRGAERGTGHLAEGRRHLPLGRRPRQHVRAGYRRRRSPTRSWPSVPDRDVTTPSGTKLTLVSPATIMRQAFAAGAKPLVRQGRVTSLQPVNPKNKPDAWETQALQAFAAGKPEYASEETIDGERYLRFMRPLIIEAACLKCHVERDRKVGEIRGGFSVAVPMAPVWAEQMADIVHRIIGYGGMWLLGLFGIAILSRHLQRQILGSLPRRRRNSKRRTNCSNNASPTGLPSWPTANGDSAKRNRRSPPGGTMAAGKRAAIPRLLRAGIGRHGHLVGRQGMGRGQRAASAACSATRRKNCC